MMSTALVNIHVWSDISCPWCYVGKTRLDQAIDNFKFSQPPDSSVEFSITWHPYIIDHQTNTNGEDYLAYNERRWGSDAWTHSLRRSGAKNGLNFQNWKWWPNSLHAHRLIHLANRHGKGSEAVQMLFLKTYEEGENVSDMNVLFEVAKTLQLPTYKEYLESDEARLNILEEDKEAKQKLKIRGVPFFTINRNISLSGAQEVQTIEMELRKALLIK